MAGVLERRGAPFVALAAAVAIFACNVPLTLLVLHQGLGGGELGIAAVVVILAVGVTVSRHQPHNPIGWLLLAIPVAVGGFLLASSLERWTQRAHPLVAVVLELATQVLYYAFVFGVPLVILFFPDGRLPSPRWRPVLRAYLTAGVAMALVTVAGGVVVALRQPVRFTATGNLAGPPAVLNVVLAVPAVVALALALSWVVRRIASYRHSTTAVRMQYKWLAVGAVGLVAALVLSFITTGGHSTLDKVDNVLTGVLLVPFPVTVGVAILRYRLYDIDRVISRTLSYALLTGLLIGLYAGLVTFATRVLPFSSPVAVASSTLIAAAAFTPLRRRLQHLVDRRFNRRRYDADAIVAAFAGRLRTTFGLGAVEEDLLVAVRRSLEPSAATVWMRPRPTVGKGSD
jgi:hypothetical protein